MKKVLSRYTLLFIMALVFVSCDDNPGDDELNGRTPGAPVMFTAMVAGDSWAATTVTATYSFLCETFIIQASAADGTSIALFFEDIESPMTFPLSEISVSSLTYTDEFGSMFSNLNSPAGENPVGQITLSDFNATTARASGQFGGSVYFGGSLSVSITGGDFESIVFTTDMVTEDCDIDGPEYPETLVNWRINDFERSANNLIDDTSNDTSIAVQYGTTAGDKVAFVFDHEIEVGDYHILQDDGATATFEIENVQQYNTGGVITIIEHDLDANYIHGVFNASVVAAVSGDNNTITDGEFFINY